MGDLLVQLQTAWPKIPDKLSASVMVRMPVRVFFSNTIYLNDPH